MKKDEDLPSYVDAFNDYFDAIDLAKSGFENKTDRGGNPYFGHLQRVAESVSDYGYIVMSAAYLHDAIEDGVFSEEILIKNGFSQRVVDLVKILTHNEFESYQEYIFRVSKDKEAIIIKLADLKDNMDITRLNKLTEADIDRLKKYHKSYKFLEETLKNL